MWGDCGMGGAARAATVLVQAWRARPASQRKRRLKRRASGFWLARRLKATVTHLPRWRGLASAPGTTLPIPIKAVGVSGAQSAARRRWGSAVRPRGGRARPLMSRCCERRTEGGPQARSAGRSAATRKEDGPAGPRPCLFYQCDASSARLAHIKRRRARRR